MTVGHQVKHVKLDDVHGKEGDFTTAVAGFDYDYIFIFFADKHAVVWACLSQDPLAELTDEVGV